MISKTSFFCTECMATVELINESFECDCQQTIYTPDEDGKPAIYDMPKGWINLGEALDCLQLCQSLFGDEWRVMVKSTLLLFILYELADLVGIPRDETDKLQAKAIAAGVKLAREEE